MNSVKRPRRIPNPPRDQVKSYHLEGPLAAKGERDRERLLAAALEIAADNPARWRSRFLENISEFGFVLPKIVFTSYD
jgi:hypothetical protein